MWRTRTGRPRIERAQGAPERAGVLLLAQVADGHAVEAARGLARGREASRTTGRSPRTCRVLGAARGRGRPPGGRRCGRRASSERRASGLAGQVAVEVRAREHEDERGCRGTRDLQPRDGVGAAPRVQGDGDIGRLAVPLALYNRLRDPGEEPRPAPGGAPVAVVGLARAGRHDERHGPGSGRPAPC